MILERVGAGGMGVVFSAYDPELDRRVAIKILGSSDIGEAARLRLLREAQAMARLSHPNVVPVYDVGAVGGRVFVAMEFVEGVTMRAWLGSEPRSWTDVLDTMGRAALGLHAAHEAGLVHRDFKPDNVMVGDDGRVRVLDFGLARSATVDDARESSDATTDAARLASVENKALAACVTSHGAMLGTPAYMPPEQLEGLSVDARADQWSFCATLYEALYGARPFEASTVAASLIAMHRGGPPPPPDASPIPRSVFDAIARGLALEPEARHPSMRALLDALQLRAVPRRRARLAAAAAVAAAIVGAAWWRAHRAEQGDAACDARAAAGAEVWSVQAQQAGAEAFERSTVSYRSDAWARASSKLADYVASWGREAGRACRSSGPDTAEIDAVRTRCLDDRLRRLESVVDAFASANDEVVRGAVETAYRLPELEPCADLPSLLATVRPPDDPDAQAELARLEVELEAAAARRISGEYPEGRELAQSVVERARALAYDPFTAKALFTLASFARYQSDYESARDGCLEAFELGASAHDDAVAAKAATELVHILGYELRSPKEAQAWTIVGNTMIARAGQRRQAPEANLRNAMGNAAFAEGDYERALSEFSAAREIWEALPGDYPIQLAYVLSNIGGVQFELGRYEESREQHLRALQIREATFGPNHPDVATSLDHLGTAAINGGDLAQARDYQQRALAIKRATLPAEHPSIATSEMHLGGTLADSGELEAAIEHLERAVAILTASRGPEHPAVARAMSNLARVYLLQDGRADEGEALLRRALEIRRGALGPKHPSVASSLQSLGEVMMARGRSEEVLPVLQEALAILTEAFGPDHAEVGECWLSLSRAHDANGQAERALDAARSAVVIGERSERSEFDLARARLQLGKLRWDLGENLADVHQLVERAERILAKTPDRAPSALAEARDWLKSHPLPRE
ncbi:serine/threonine-protein kinase [Paraliomyxa miuraensis]|uniref:serine/threonine-protein kinase n=1 Tax=Paraliomyxa miuraensis TaxID=376150 RepID=UPI00225529F6|nr:serine/threonine-protein kinase [Paraliomyxa miuraensis]MCX4239300.1 tetratricopeptide repeat protein [Paraliomyxa miuraensis]